MIIINIVIIMKVININMKYKCVYFNVSFSKFTSSLETLESTVNILGERGEERDDRGGLCIVKGKTGDSSLERFELLVTLLELVVPCKVNRLDCSL